MLFRVTARDPITFVAVAVLLTIIALLACYIPARRASRGRSDGRIEIRIIENINSRPALWRPNAPQANRIVSLIAILSLALGIGRQYRTLQCR
jgi:ABC-type lipoprotein release transport system permease subunit